jgi:hypothetical protein
VVGLWVWRAETASGLERVWIGAMAISTGFALWGLARALQTRGWVDDEQHRNPRLDYAAARAVAQTHTVTHACILTSTVALLLFGLVAASVAPANPGARPSHVGLAFTAALLLVGAVKTFLNIYLVIRRETLVRVVQSIGGD